MYIDLENKSLIEKKYIINYFEIKRKDTYMFIKIN